LLADEDPLNLDRVGSANALREAAACTHKRAQ
jgi:hypothetical protein